MNVLMIYPEFPDTFWSFKHAMKFINKSAANPPLGLITVAALLPSDWQVKLVDLNVRKVKESEWKWSDMIFLSAMAIQRYSVEKVIAECQLHHKIIVAGGPLFTQEYESFTGINHFVLNEAELTLPQFICDLSQGTPKNIYSSPDYPDITLSPIPRFDLLQMDRYDAMSIQYSRGCPYDCNFCNVTALFGHKPRVKSVNQLIGELDALYAAGWRRNIFFVDDNFIGNKRHIKEDILPALVDWKKDKTGCLFITEASINLADDETLMNLMSLAGFTSVFIGIETPSESGLVECHKTQNINRNLLDSIHNIQNHGIQVMAGFIIGFDSDQPGIFEDQFRFIQQSGIITAMVGILQAPYGTRLYAQLMADHRIIDGMNGDNADGTTNIITKMNIDYVTKNYKILMKKLYAPKHFYSRIYTFLKYFKPASKPVTMHLEEIGAFFKTIWHMGVISPEKKEYWKLFFSVLRDAPSKLPIAITLAVYGYHFRSVADLHLK
jgi:radical SAM superfamily enzyme YgiQ (UPF0313 family)